MSLTPEKQIEILQYEHKYLIDRDLRLTTFYQRFSTIGPAFIGIVTYYATLNHAIFHVLPFLIPLLLLFLLYWRMDTVATNAYLAKIEERINKIAGEKLLTYKQIIPRPDHHFRHPPTGRKIFNPLYVFTWIMIVAFAAILVISYVNVYRYFSTGDRWMGWFVIYCITNGLLLLGTGGIFLFLEGGKRIYEYWDKVAGSEYSSPRSEPQ